MRAKLYMTMALLVAGGLISGCIIAPDGYGHRHHHHHSYYDRD